MADNVNCHRARGERPENDWRTGEESRIRFPLAFQAVLTQQNKKIVL
jgi:hypothetical protein